MNLLKIYKYMHTYINLKSSFNFLGKEDTFVQVVARDTNMHANSYVMVA
jgi:hypothetical protein